jgi:hypothetical protein
VSNEIPQIGHKSFQLFIFYMQDVQQSMNNWGKKHRGDTQKSHSTISGVERRKSFCRIVAHV